MKCKASKPFEERNAGTQKRYPVPVAPILRVIEQWLEETSLQQQWQQGVSEHGYHTKEGSLASPFEVLATVIDTSPSTATRMIYRMRNQESTYTDFKTADKIITALYGPHHWYVDDELRAIYEEHA